MTGYISGSEATKSSPLTSDSITKCLTPFLKNDSLATQRFGYGLDQWPKQIAGAIPINQRQEYLSMSGKFSIHYDTEGVDEVPNEDANENGIPDFVEWAAEAADSSYQLQVNELGYPDPKPIGTSYDIYLKDLSSYGAYGLTNTSRSGIFACGANTSSTCIYSENDFVGYPGNYNLSYIDFRNVNDIESK